LLGHILAQGNESTPVHGEIESQIIRFSLFTTFHVASLSTAWLCKQNFSSVLWGSAQGEGEEDRGWGEEGDRRRKRRMRRMAERLERELDETVPGVLPRRQQIRRRQISGRWRRGLQTRKLGAEGWRCLSAAVSVAV
jgi:hypothetical protein